MLYTPPPQPILYVDDELPNQVVFQAAFGQEFEIVCASSGSEALDLLAGQPFSVLVTDHRMPGMSGVTLCERVRARYPRVARLLVTAYSEHQTVIDAINRGGVRQYIPKPWDVDALGELLLQVQRQVTRERAAGSLHAVIRENEVRIQRTLFQALYVDELLDGIDRSLDIAQDLVEQAPATIQPSTRQLLEILEDLRRNAVLSEEDPAIEPEALPLADTLSLVAPLIEVELSGCARLELDCPSDLVVNADHTLLNAILVNLAQHGCRAMRAAGVPWGAIRIRAAQHGDHVFVDVIDQAPTMPEAISRRLFEPAWGGVSLAVAQEIAATGGFQISVGEPPGGAGNTLRVRI